MVGLREAVNRQNVAVTIIVICQDIDGHINVLKRNSAIVNRFRHVVDVQHV